MINLSSLTPFAKGGNRECFIHPNDPDRCLKVIHPELIKEKMLDAPWYKKFRFEFTFDDNLREKEGYNQKSLKTSDPEVWKHLAKWYGMVMTSHGFASETELITNDGEIAETLENYLFREGLTDEIKDSINQFHQWLRDYLILTKNLIPHNLVLKKDGGEIIIKIIDGLGSKSFIPLPNYSNFFAKRYVERRIELMWSRINWDLSGRKGNWK